MPQCAKAGLRAPHEFPRSKRTVPDANLIKCAFEIGIRKSRQYAIRLSKFQWPERLCDSSSMCTRRHLLPIHEYAHCRAVIGARNVRPDILLDHWSVYDRAPCRRQFAVQQKPDAAVRIQIQRIRLVIQTDVPLADERRVESIALHIRPGFKGDRLAGN